MAKLFFDENTPDFINVKNGSFILRDEEISCSLAFVKDASNFILCIIKERGLNPYQTFRRISVGAGHGFLKCIVHVFNPSYKYTTSENLDDSGVKR